MVHDRALGLVSPVIALVFAVLGCLLGIILATRARSSRGAPKVRLIAYTSIAIGVGGVWQSAVVDLTGMRVADSVLLLHPVPLALALGPALGASTIAVVLCTYGRANDPRRWVSAGLVLAAGVAGCQYLVLGSVTTGGELTYGISVAGLTIGLALGAGLALGRAMGDTRALRHAFLGAALVSALLSALHVGSALSVQVRTGPGHEITGVDPMRVAVLTMLAGAVLTALLWFFSAGTSTRRDLKLVFKPEPERAQIAAWMVERLGTSEGLVAPTDDRPDPMGGEPGVATAYLSEGADAHGLPAPLPGRRALAPRPTPGITPAWRAMPVWGRPAPADPASNASRPAAAAAAQVAAAANSARTRARDWAQRDTAERTGDWANTRERGTNSRTDQRPGSPAPLPAPVTGGSDAEEAAIIRPTGPGTPLPRRNARP